MTYLTYLTYLKKEKKKQSLEAKLLYFIFDVILETLGGTSVEGFSKTGPLSGELGCKKY